MSQPFDSGAQLPSLRRYIYTFVLLLALVHIVALFMPVLAGRIAFGDIDYSYLRGYIPSPMIIGSCAIIVSALLAVDCALKGFGFGAMLIGTTVIAGLAVALSVWFLQPPFLFTLTGNLLLDFAIFLFATAFVVAIATYVVARMFPASSVR